MHVSRHNGVWARESRGRNARARQQSIASERRTSRNRPSQWGRCTCTGSSGTDTHEAVGITNLVTAFGHLRAAWQDRGVSRSERAGVGRETMLSRHAQGLRMGYPSSRRVQPAHSRRDGARARRFQNLCGTSGYRVNSHRNPAAVRGRRSECIIARPESARHRHATLLWGARPASRRRRGGFQSLPCASGGAAPDR